MSSLKNSFIEARWDLWYQDSFDWECPRQKILSGSGLIKGLRALWVRHLYEGINPKGLVTFSHFNLFWQQKDCSIQIEGDIKGQIKLRQWIFEGRLSDGSDLLRIADTELLDLVVKAHSLLILSGHSSEKIINRALKAKDHDLFIYQLLALISELDKFE